MWEQDREHLILLQSEEKNIWKKQDANHLCRVSCESSAFGSTAKTYARLDNSAKMTLEEVVISVMGTGRDRGQDNGSPSYRRPLYLWRYP